MRIRSVLLIIGGLGMTAAFNIALANGWFGDVPAALVKTIAIVSLYVWVGASLPHDSVRRMVQNHVMLSLFAFLIGGMGIGALTWVIIRAHPVPTALAVPPPSMPVERATQKQPAPLISQQQPPPEGAKPAPTPPSSTKQTVGTEDAVNVGVRRGTKDNAVGPPPKQKTGGLQLTVSLVGSTDPNIVVDNQTDNLAEGITWELVMFRTTDQAFFSYATQNIGYVKPHSKSARYAMQLNTLAQAPGGGQIENGQSFIGTLALDCPTCSGTTLIVSFVWGSGGWFYEIPGGNGRLLLPTDMSKDTISKFIEGMNASVKPEDRIPIL